MMRIRNNSPELSDDEKQVEDRKPALRRVFSRSCPESVSMINIPDVSIIELDVGSVPTEPRPASSLPEVSGINNLSEDKLDRYVSEGAFNDAPFPSSCVYSPMYDSARVRSVRNSIPVSFANSDDDLVETGMFEMEREESIGEAIAAAPARSGSNPK